MRLVKDHDQPLGLTIAGGCDKFSLARVEHLRAGGLASRCDLLQGKWRLFKKIKITRMLPRIFFSLLHSWRRHRFCEWH